MKKYMFRLKPWCACCGHDFEEGEACYKVDGEYICDDCMWEEFQDYTEEEKKSMATFYRGYLVQ